MGENIADYLNTPWVNVSVIGLSLMKTIINDLEFPDIGGALKILPVKPW